VPFIKKKNVDQPVTKKEEIQFKVNPEIVEM
jgi:hypothetical protein